MLSVGDAVSSTQACGWTSPAPTCDAKRCCRWCGQPLLMPATGRRPSHCSASCRWARGNCERKIARRREALADWLEERGQGHFTRARIRSEVGQLRAEIGALEVQLAGEPDRRDRGPRRPGKVSDGKELRRDHPARSDSRTIGGSHRATASFVNAALRARRIRGAARTQPTADQTVQPRRIRARRGRRVAVLHDDQLPKAASRPQATRGNAK